MAIQRLFVGLSSSSVMKKTKLLHSPFIVFVVLPLQFAFNKYSIFPGTLLSGKTEDGLNNSLLLCLGQLIVERQPK